MRLFEVINTVWRVDVLANTRNQQTSFARFQAYKIMYDDYQMTLADIGRNIGKHHATIISGLKQFESLMMYDRDFETKYKLVRAMLSNAGADRIKPISENQFIKDIAIQLEDLTDKELIDFLPRVDIYKKSVIYNRKKKKQWERTSSN